MKIGVIADIHGDYTALTTALDRLEHQHRVEHILCAGDLVGRGPRPEEVVQLIRQRGIPSVKGNHDEWAAGVSADSVRYLESLPINWQQRFGSNSIYMCHGKPGSNVWGLYRDHVSDTLLNMMLGSLKADVLIVGHTHVPMFIRVANGIVVNPGSLYTFDSMRATSHTYGILNLPELTFDLYDLTVERMEPVAI
ncbi:MAG TPA: metallophosphoesterase family protein [Aggregatilineales bacterium]|nr:metallophosphoesterase family protein [Anaerolineae bacterium]HUN06318.1 metallophosphoesterase family protein [Aggregatilineales bacterium]